MRLHILSDLHIDVIADFVPAAPSGTDLVVVAGDVCEGPDLGMAFLRRHIPPPLPIVMVSGNHEYYHHALIDERQATPAYAQRQAITHLDDAEAVIAGVRILGATLWTDFRLHGADQRQMCMLAAQDFMGDFKCIARRRDRPERLTPRDTIELHQASLGFLRRTLATPHAGPTIVVTHHAPHPGSVADRYRGDPVTPAFVSDLSTLIEGLQPALWVHGHTHTSFDYRVGATRIVANPKGYGRENAAFDPDLTLDL